MKRITAILLALVLCICVLSIGAFATEDTITVRVEIDTDTAPNAWAWGEKDVFEKWPGEPMTKNGDYWEIQVPVGTTGFIVNNGAAQTSDITIAGDKDVTIKVAADFSSFEVVEGGKEQVKPENLYVAGVGALCGSEWSSDDEANKMTEGDNGIFTKVYKSVAAGEYQLKVTDGTWDNCWGGDGPDGNYAFSLTGTSDVTVKFDSTKYEISVDIVAVDGEPTPPPEAPKPENLYVAGVGALCGSEWSCDDEANKMTEGEDGIFTKVYKDVAAGDYALKVTDGTWTNSWGGEGADGNYEFSLTEVSDVTVKFDVANLQVSVVIGEVEDETPEQKPEEKPEEKPEQKPEEKPEEEPEEKPDAPETEEKEENIDYGARKTKALIIIGTAVLAIVAVSFALSIPKKIQ